MTDEGLLYFASLKKEIVSVLKQSYPSIPSNIEDWKGQDIVFLQEDLMDKVQSSISEKWFYTHIKLPSQKLPRIDMLNLLSRYVGFNDWNDFKENKKDKVPTTKRKKVDSKVGKWRIGIISLIVVLSIISFFIYRPKTYTFCFYDADQRTLLKDQEIEIILLNDGESPIYKRCTDGCFSIKSSKTKLRFVVKTPYYKVDTITRILNNHEKNEIVQLHTNNYALMIHFFSKSKIDDWKKRRKQLNVMFNDNAQIYQMFNDEGIGMELYNKKEFINKLTMPLKSLKNIEIIETVYTGNKISILKFRQIQKPLEDE